MRFRSLILMVLAVLCTSQVMAQSKRNVRKRPATNRTVVKKNKKPAAKPKEAALPVDSQTVAPAPAATPAPAAPATTAAPATPATAAPVTATPATAATSATPATPATPATVPSATPAAKAKSETSLLPPPASVVPQDRVDTIYYNKNWKVITNKAFASYLCLVSGESCHG